MASDPSLDSLDIIGPDTRIESRLAFGRVLLIP
jgi:hypothetical protein